MQKYFPASCNYTFDKSLPQIFVRTCSMPSELVSHLSPQAQRNSGDAECCTTIFPAFHAIIYAPQWINATKSSHGFLIWVDWSHMQSEFQSPFSSILKADDLGCYRVSSMVHAAKMQLWQSWLLEGNEAELYPICWDTGHIPQADLWVGLKTLP